MAQQIHGPYFDPLTKDIDGEVAMRAGGGKKHGRYWIGDGTIDLSSTPTLNEIRAKSTSQSPTIRPRPTAAQLQTEAIQARLEQETKRREELEARHEQEMKRHEELEVRVVADAQFQEMYLYIQVIGAQMGRPPPPSLFALPGAASTPNQSATSNDVPNEQTPPSWGNW